MMPDQVRKWLRQQSKNFYAAGLDKLVKAMGQVYQYWWRICREINALSKFECHMFYVLYLWGPPTLIRAPANHGIGDVQC
jgi:hypothetical protein